MVFFVAREQIFNLVAVGRSSLLHSSEVYLILIVVEDDLLGDSIIFEFHLLSSKLVAFLNFLKFGRNFLQLVAQGDFGPFSGARSKDADLWERLFGFLFVELEGSSLIFVLR